MARRLDGEYRWSLFIKADPTAGDDVEGLVYAVSHDRKRAAVVGLAPKGRVYEVAELLRDTTTDGLDLREVARQLQRGGGLLWGKPRAEGQIE